MEERQRRGGRRERMGLKNEFGDSRRVWSFFSCSCLVGERQRERETAEAKMERRRDGERWRDRHDGVTDRETVRRGEKK